MEKSIGPYILGLDLGVQSIGWAVIPVDTSKISRDTIRLGVRCFDGGAGSRDGELTKPEDSPNSTRRAARSVRRLLARRRRRMVKLFNILKLAGLLPNWKSNTPELRQDFINRLDVQLREEYFCMGSRMELDTVLYRLRAMALDRELSRFALGRILYHLGQRRGFLSNRKAVKKDKDDETGKVKGGISELGKEIEESHSRTLGEYFSTIDPEKQRIRQRYTSRQMYRDEFDCIWEKQASYYPDLLTEQLRKKIENAIFFQRPLKSQKFLIGSCELEKGHRKASAADILFQRFRYWQKLIDLEILDKDGFWRKLKREEQDKLAEEFDKKEKLTFSDMRKVLGLKQPKEKKEKEGEEKPQDTEPKPAEKKQKPIKIYSFNFEVDSDKEKGLPGNKTLARIRSKLDKYGVNASEEDYEKIVREILQFGNETALASRLEKVFGYESSLAEELSQITLQQGYASLSRKAMSKLLDKMREERIPLATARKQLYPEKHSATKGQDFLPPLIGKDGIFRRLNNPTVIRTLSELRKVVNQLIREYGKPAYCRIELARDLKRGQKEKEKIYLENSRRNKERERIRERIIRETNFKDPSPADVTKWLLAEECNWHCPYTGRQITPNTLLGDYAQFDIEHIIPFSRSLDNSLANKTLCWAEENRNIKKNKTPWEYYGGDPQRWHEILVRVGLFHSREARRKLERFKRQEVEPDFANRMLSDTRYISRLAADYIALLFGGIVDDQGKRRVQTNTGGMTAWLRSEWELNRILKDGNEKNRNDHRHHAVDAVAIALSSPGMIQELAHAAELASENHSRRLFLANEIPAPVADFYSVVKDAVDKINVSYRVSRKVSGGFHKETNYAVPSRSANDGNDSIKHIRKSLLSFTKRADFEDIVDPKIREIVLDKFDRLAANGEKFNENNLPELITKDGRRIPIKKVRIKKTTTTIPVGRRHFRAVRNVEPGSNHHIEIVSTVDRYGREKWEGIVVSSFEAYQRKKNGQPVIQRDHGPGKRFVCSLTQREHFVMQEKEENEQLFIVKGVRQNKSIQFASHCDARKSHDCRRAKSVEELRKSGMRKVHVDPLGNIVPARD